jgi:hypothetical protein
LRLDFRRRRAGEARADPNGWQVHRREPVHVEMEITRGAHDHKRENDHRSEDRPADADFGKLLHG